MPNLKQNDQFHIKGRQGTFTVVSTDNEGIFYTTKKWQSDSNEKHPVKYIYWPDFQCLVGKRKIN